VATTQLRECRQCREIVGVIDDVHDESARQLTDEHDAELWRALNRCPICDGTQHVPVRRVGGLRRKGVRCPRCGARLHEEITARTD
jgi:predicted nucleic acid-binding Zn ribbon protein